MVALCCGRGNDVNATMLLACSPTIATSTGTRSSPPILGRGLIAGKARPLNHSWTQVNSGARRTLTLQGVQQRPRLELVCEIAVEVGQVEGREAHGGEAAEDARGVRAAQREPASPQAG